MRHSPSGSSRLNPLVLFGAVFALLGASLVPNLHAQAPGARPAGKITALIPQDFITRGPQRLEAAKDASVFWNDVIETGRGGRVRVNLLDGSTLNIGSQAKMRIQQHDEVSQQTSLELSYGKVRASVVKLAQPGSKFEVKTPQAVCGVVGTDEYLDSNPNSTQVISLFGRIVVGSSDPNLPGTETLDTGELTDVFTGQGPRPKRRATEQELLQAIQETLEAISGDLSTPVGYPGDTLQAEFIGRNLMPVTQVSVTGEGVEIEVGPGANATRVPLTIRIAPNAPPGGRVIILETPREQVLAGFLVRSPREAGAVSAVISGQWWYRPDAPPEDVTPPNLTVARGARVLLDGSRSTGPVTAYGWEIPGAWPTVYQTTFDIDTGRLSPGSHRVTLRVSSVTAPTSQAELTLTIRPLPNPDDVLIGLRSAYETLQINQFMSFFDPLQFRAYPALEENMRNALQDLSEIRVYLRIDNRQVLGDDAAYQAAFEITFSTKDAPTQIQRRIESITMRLRLDRQREGETWRIVDYSSDSASTASRILSVGTGTGSEIFGLTGSAGSPDFTLSLSPSSLEVPVGGSGLVDVTITAQNGFNQAVNITVEGLPAGVTVSPLSLSGSTWHLVFTASPTAAPQSATVNVVGTDASGQIQHAVALELRLIGDFDLASSPSTSSGSPAALLRGGSTSVRVDVIGRSNFQGNVSLTLDSLPIGLSADRTSATVAAGGNATFVFSASPTAPLGPVQVTLRGSAGTIQKTLTLFLAIGDFDLASSPATSSSLPAVLNTGGSTSIRVDVLARGGFTGQVNLSVDSLAGISASPASTTVAAGSGVTIVFSAAATAPTGPVQVTVRGSVGATQKTLVLFLDIRPAPSFNLIVNPTTSNTSPLDLVAGDSVSFSVSLEPLNGFTGSVNVSLDAVSGLLIDPSSATLSVGSSVSFRVQATSQVTPETFQLTIRGISGTIERTASLFLRVQSFQLVVTPATSSGSALDLTQGSQTSFTVQLVGLNGFSGSANIMVQPPAGLSASPSSATLNAGGSFNLLLTAVSGLGVVETAVRAQRGTFQTSASIFLNISAPPTLFTFSISEPVTSSSSPLELAPGGTFPLNISFSRASGFTGAVTFTFTSDNLAIGVSPQRIVIPNPQTRVSATISVADVAEPGLAQITVTASGSFTQTATIFLFVVEPFQLSVSPTADLDSPIVLSTGASTGISIIVIRQGGFTGNVSLSIVSTSFDLDLFGAGSGECFTPCLFTTLTSSQHNFSFQAHAVSEPSLPLPENVLVIINATVGSFVLQQTVAFRIVPPQISLVVSGAGASPSSPLGVTQGCGSTSLGPTSTLSLGASGTGGTLYVSCTPSSPTGTVVGDATGFDFCPIALSPGGGTHPFNVQATTLAALGSLSFTITGFATSSLITPMSTVTVYLDILDGSSFCAHAPPGDTVAGNQVTKVKPGSETGETGGGGATPGGKGTFAVDVDMKARSSAPAILGVQPDRAVAGEQIQVVLVGQNLASAQAVRSSAEAISVTVAGPAEDQRLVVTLRLSEHATPGTYLLAVEGAAGSASVPFTVLPRAQAAEDSGAREQAALGRDEGRRVALPKGPGKADLEQTVAPSGSARLADLVVSRDEISISPAMPRAGDTVTFRVPVRNEGQAAAQDVVVEFSIPDANLTARETISLGPGRSTTLVFEWPAARATAGRGVEPRLVLDPDNRVPEATKQNNAATLARLIVEGGSEDSVPAALRASSGNAALRAHADRTTVELVLGECAGLRLSGGATSTCSGSADLELRLSDDGTSFALGADAVRPLAAATLEQVTAVEQGGGAREVPVEVGRVYAVSSRGQAAAVRVRAVRGLEQARAERAARPPAALDSPRVARHLEDDVADVRGRVKSGKRVHVELEWILLPETH